MTNPNDLLPIIARRHYTMNEKLTLLIARTSVGDERAPAILARYIRYLQHYAKKGNPDGKNTQR